MKNNRTSYRLINYDYSRKGLYFVTICTHKRECFFGKIVDKQMQQSEIGKIAHQYFEDISIYYPHIEVLAMVIMPNHVHGLLYFTEGASHDEQISTFGHVVPQSLSVIINQYKGAVTKYVNRHNIRFKWQVRFHDSIVWDEKHCQNVIQYIESNVDNWCDDDFFMEEYPQR